MTTSHIMARKKKRHSKQRSPQGRRYPPPAVRRQLIERRHQILGELIGILAGVPPAEHPDAVQGLMARYSYREVTYVMGAFQEMGYRELIGEEAFLYRQYRQAYARYGGRRPFLNAQDHEELTVEHGQLMARRNLAPSTSTEPAPREQELHDLLFLGIQFWDDLMPPDTPPRPAGFQSPPSGTYERPVKGLLSWGWTLNEGRIKREAGKRRLWLPVTDQIWTRINADYTFCLARGPNPWQIRGHLRSSAYLSGQIEDCCHLWTVIDRSQS